ncbi:proline-rich protein 5-like isoform X5 [Heliangelus exortis]|uniref:proline-rich protein 5-like isoform X5 n=1 Tax=Heliangelus exortis TaxID=472823 RepID=UPI003A91C9EA
MGSFRRPRPRFMSSPVLSDLPRFQAARQALQLSSNSAWHRVQTAVINVFKGGGLQKNELYTLNENIRWLLKSELGSFITDYFQGQELTIRQIALLGFRDLVLLKVKLEEILPLVQTKLPASIVQMLLILQSVHEPTGPSEGYLQLEELVKQVVSPYLGLCEDHSFSGSTCVLERQFPRSRGRAGMQNHPSRAVLSRQPSEMALSPLTEQEGEAYLEKCGSVRRHTVANAHSDLQLLAMASMLHTGMVTEEADSPEKCLLLQPSFSPRHCSSEPSIAEGPEAAGRQEPAELSCTPAS